MLLRIMAKRQPSTPDSALVTFSKTLEEFKIGKSLVREPVGALMTDANGNFLEVGMSGPDIYVYAGDSGENNDEFWKVIATVLVASRWYFGPHGNTEWSVEAFQWWSIQKLTVGQMVDKKIIPETTEAVRWVSSLNLL